MSIQTFRERIADHRGALMGADAEFATDLSKRYDALKAKATGAHPADLRRLQNEVTSWLGTYAARKDCDQGAYEGAMAWRDLLQADIDLQVFAATAGPEGTAPHGGWINAQTREPVKLYGAGDKIAKRPDGRASELSLGALLEGLLMGTKSSEVRNALQIGTDSAGGYSVPTHILPEFIDKLRAKTQFVNAGARTMILDGGMTRIVRTDADPVAAWRSESAAINESAPSFGMIEMTPHSLAVITRISRELLADSVNVQDALERALIGAMSTKLDYAAFFGVGASNEPLGLANITGINSVSMGTNGATPTSYDDLLDMLYELELDNANAPTAAVWHPRTARTYRKLKDTTNQPMEAPAPLDSLPMLSTTSFPINQTQGSATGVCSTVLMGDYTQAILGIREQLNIQVLNQTYAATGELAFVAHLRADVAFAHPESFVELIGVKP